jgi:broad specificity phosphatase PhoE
MNLCRVMLALALVACTVFAASAEPTDVRTFVLVRHAERSTSDGDTSLSEAGRDRAQALAHLLRDVNFQAIYVSQMIRTKETAAPIAHLKGLEPQSIATTEMDRLMEKLRNAPAGAAVLVVHHSGTIPQIVQKLGASTSAIREEEFDRLLVVTVPSQGKPSVLTLRFGAR